jgi:hypothetical protein
MQQMIVEMQLIKTVRTRQYDMTKPIIIPADDYSVGM